MDIDRPRMDIPMYVTASADTNVRSCIDISMNNAIFLYRNILSPDTAK